MLAPGHVLAGHYRVISELGKGGMGRVYLAHHEDLDAKVALKELLVPETADARHIERFRTEGRILHKLRHARLPLVYDFFRDGDQYYIAMEFVDGQPLNQLVHDQGSADPNIVRQWGLQLCEVLEYLHSQTPVIVFRDLKPSNIMITADGELKLIDFGIAKLFDEETGGETSTSIRGAGTPGFAPPEQYGAGTDERADIYALGATLYSVAAGKIPPTSVSLAAGVEKLIPLRELRPDLPVPVCDAIHHMMAVRREDRPQTIREARTELNRVAIIEDRTSLLRAAATLDDKTGVMVTEPMAAPETNLVPHKSTSFGLLLASIVGLGLLVIGLLSVLIHHTAAPVVSDASPSASPSATPSPVAVVAPTHRAAPPKKKTHAPQKTSTPKPVVVQQSPTPEPERTVVVLTTPANDATPAQPPPPPPPTAPAQTPDLYLAYREKALQVVDRLDAAVRYIPTDGRGGGVERLEDLLSELPSRISALQHDPGARQGSYGAIAEAANQLGLARQVWNVLKDLPDPPEDGGGAPPGPPPPGMPPPDPNMRAKVDGLIRQLTDARAKAADAVANARNALNNNQ